MENKILSLSELAERMSVSKQRVQQFTQDGLVQRVAHGRLTIPKFYVNESQDECLNMEELEGVIQRDLEKLKAGKKDYQGIGRTYRIRGNGVTSNVRIGDDLKSSRPPTPR